MRSLFEVGFHNNFQRPSMGCIESIITAALPALITGGAAVWSQREQLKLQKKIRREEEARAAAEEAKAAAEEKAIQEEAAKAVQEERAAAAAAGPQILGVPRDIAIIGGVGLIVVLGAVVVLVASSGGAAPAAITQ